MQVVWHDYICIDSQSLFADAKPHAIDKDLDGFWIDENRQPFDDGEGDKIDINTVNKIITIHKVIIWRFTEET